MELIIDVLVVLVFFVLVVREIMIIKRLRISTKKTFFEAIVYVLGTLVCIIIMVLYGKSFLHYFLGVLGIIFFSLEFFKQGILEDGIAFTARGKGTCRWSEITKAQIAKSNKLKVTYWSCTEGDITHNYVIDRCEDIVNILAKNNIKFDIKYDE